MLSENLAYQNSFFLLSILLLESTRSLLLFLSFSSYPTIIIGWFKIVEFTSFYLKEVAKGNTEYIDKPFARLSHFSTRHIYVGTRIHVKLCLKNYPRSSETSIL